MKKILTFDEIEKEDFYLVGGKAYNLGIMVNLGLPVPKGFVVTTNSYKEFLEKNRIEKTIQRIVKSCDVENTEELLKVSKKIKDLIVSQEFPKNIEDEILKKFEELNLKKVAVRSSAVAEDLPFASFAGQMASFLNVRKGELIENIKKCWASLFEPRAIFYRKKNNIEEALIAVIVQKMVNSEKSGVMFTINPTTSEDEIVIEAIYGLGELIVSGQVNPDLYIVSKDSKKILKKNISEKSIKRIWIEEKNVDVNVEEELKKKQVLEDQEILKLAEYGKLLEKYYKKPQDIEFAIEKNNIYIVQTRAITTFLKKDLYKADQEPILEGLAASPGIAVGKAKIIKKFEDIVKIKEGDVLVTEMTYPDLVPAMSKCSAIITDKGGITSHAAIVSRELQIPCVVGTENATQILQDNQLITVDAYNGKIYAGKISIERGKEEKFYKKTKTLVKLNVAFSKNLEEYSKYSDGVGLLRLEHIVMENGYHPAYLSLEEYKNLLVKSLLPIIKIFEGKPIWIRSLDMRSDEYRNLKGSEFEPIEPNPMLGWHGIRRSLDQPKIIQAELEAIKEIYEKGFSNVHLMLPFVINVNEFLEVKKIAKILKMPEDFKIGIMVETPAAALQIDEFCKSGISFASIGSNDLTMLVLGVDRNNEKISNLYNEQHPAVFELMRKIIETCNNYKVESSICGEAGSDPKIVTKLVKIGISSVSCNLDALYKIRKAVYLAET